MHSLDDFWEQLGGCDECPLQCGEGASPIVRLLVTRHHEAARAHRKLGQRARAAEAAVRDLEATAERNEERLATLAHLQKASAEEAEAALQAEMDLVAQKEAAILALSTPILHVLDGVVVLPLIGELDARRAEMMTNALLDEVARSSARHVVVDLTGIHAMTAETAEHLLRVAHAARLLGAEVELSGLRADVARTVIELGVDLSRIRTRSSLKQAIAHASRTPRAART
ncbi:STAS domain-containing protein [Polyangium jinanense]|uniref:STAS domain-containing protein n=1 Tax=Polyangium jinanense TaxID=2829994 RepID=A0A9X4AVY3_9BACT|nr:STAS domain-containing protein [Polyangium jinanense]MDC3960045.1 STAS domain-containing protein [Polyangium jinanense]MDC3986181.1 STAS domain-containing protein [Polyangium jinanense]